MTMTSSDKAALQQGLDMLDASVTILGVAASAPYSDPQAMPSMTQAKTMIRMIREFIASQTTDDNSSSSPASSAIQLEMKGPQQ